VRRMTRPILQVIDGGPHPGPAVIDPAIAAIPFDALLTRLAAEQLAARAEADAAAAVGQVMAAVAILAKSKADLVSLIAAAGLDQAADGHAALRRALAGADVLLAVLRAAEARFTIARAAAATRADCFR
jgi:hypothetical protein